MGGMGLYGGFTGGFTWLNQFSLGERQDHLNIAQAPGVGMGLDTTDRMGREFWAVLLEDVSLFQVFLGIHIPSQEVRLGPPSLHKWSPKLRQAVMCRHYE